MTSSTPASHLSTDGLLEEHRALRETLAGEDELLRRALDAMPGAPD